MNRWRIELLCVAVIAATWLGYAMVGPPVTQSISARFGARILAATQGNAADTRAFIGTCVREAVLLLSAVAAAVVVHGLLARLWLKSRSRRSGAWIFHSAVGFLLANTWLALAAHTTLFWCLMSQGENTHNVVRFRLKAALLRAHPSTRKAVILGNSQARAQLDEALLNQLLEPELHTAELHFPGSRAYDIALVSRKLATTRLQVVICYVSELNFYAGASSDVVPVFFGFEDLGDCRALPVCSHIKIDRLAYGLLGDLLPAFNLRDVFAQRLLGSGLAHVRERSHAREKQTDAEAARRQNASSYRLDHAADFQKQAFAAFAARCERQNQTLIILAGQLNPALARYFDPTLRADLMSFLRVLRDQHSNIVLLDELPAQADSDYDDLTHINKTKQAEFTRYFAGQLKSKILAPPAN